MDSDHLIHHLEDPANAISPYPSFYEGPRFNLNSSPQDGWQNHRPAPEPVRERYDDNCTLWVGNLDMRVTETMLFELFSQVGDVKNITFPKPKQDEEKVTGFCFVNFLVPDSVPKAIEIMQGTVLFGRRLFLKYRPDSIHAMHAPKSHRMVKLVKNSSSPRLGTRNPFPFTGKPFRSHGRSRVVELRGKDTYDGCHNVSSTDAKYSPIRAPSPDANNFRGAKEKKSVSPDNKYREDTDRGSETSRRKVVIRSSSGSVVPVVNIPNSVEPKISSVVVTPQTKKTVSKCPESRESNTPQETIIEHATSTTNNFNHSNLPPSAEERHDTAMGSHVSNDQSVNLHGNFLRNTQQQYSCSQDPYYQHHYDQNQSFQQWQPPTAESVHSNQNTYPAPPEMEGRPIMPHYNRYVWFNGNSRYPNNFQRSRPNFQGRQNSYNQHTFGNVNNNAYPRPPAPYYNPRFVNFRPRFNNNQFPQHNMHYQQPPPSLEHQPNFYFNTNPPPLRQMLHQKPPPPPCIRSRSRTRSRTRSKSPYRSRCYSDYSKDRFSRSLRSNSKSPPYGRRSKSRESSCDRYYRSRRTSRSTSSDRDSYHLRKRQRRSRSYSSSAERHKSGEFRPVSATTSVNRYSSSSESDHDKNDKAMEGSAAASEFSESENDVAAVSSSSQKAGSAKKGKGKLSNKQFSKDTALKSKKKSRSSARMSETEEYDPSDPGY